MEGNLDTKYISLTEAAGGTGYTQEYLSLRARQGKLKALKFGREWVTTKDWVDEYLNALDKAGKSGGSEEVKEARGEFISLARAAELSQYSQDYLSLRARRGKLKAVKFGRNWVIKKDWLDEYLKTAEDYKKKISATREPIADEPEEPEEPAGIEFPPAGPWQKPVLVSALTAGLVLVLLAGTVVWGRASFSYVYRGLMETSAGALAEASESFANVGRDIANLHQQRLMVRSAIQVSLRRAWEAAAGPLSRGVTRIGIWGDLVSADSGRTVGGLFSGITPLTYIISAGADEFMAESFTNVSEGSANMCQNIDFAMADFSIRFASGLSVAFKGVFGQTAAFFASLGAASSNAAERISSAAADFAGRMEEGLEVLVGPWRREIREF